MSQQVLLDISTAPARSIGQALRHAKPQRTDQERKDRRNELSRQRTTKNPRRHRFMRKKKGCDKETIEQEAENEDGNTSNGTLVDFLKACGKGAKKKLGRRRRSDKKKTELREGPDRESLRSEKTKDGSSKPTTGPGSNHAPAEVTKTNPNQEKLPLAHNNGERLSTPEPSAKDQFDTPRRATPDFSYYTYLRDMTPGGTIISHPESKSFEHQIPAVGHCAAPPRRSFKWDQEVPGPDRQHYLSILPDLEKLTV